MVLETDHTIWQVVVWTPEEIDDSKFTQNIYDVNSASQTYRRRVSKFTDSIHAALEEADNYIDVEGASVKHRTSRGLALEEENGDIARIVEQNVRGKLR